MRRATSFVLLVTSAAVAACGGAGTTSPNTEGAAIFGRNCSACHSLLGNESRHRQGGDLIGYRLSRRELLEFTREMPTRRPLTSSQLQRVVDYVLESERRARAH